MENQFLTFEYAIRHPEHGFYIGTARDRYESNFSHNKREAFTYTETGAYRKRDLFFADCEIIRVS